MENRKPGGTVQVTTEDRDGAFARWALTLIGSASAVFLALTPYMPPPPVHLGLFILCNLLALGMAVSVVTERVYELRGTWVVDESGIEFRARNGRSTAIRWTEVETVSFRRGCVVLQSGGLQILFPGPMLCGRQFAYARRRIEDHLKSASDAPDPRTDAARLAFHRSKSAVLPLAASTAAGVIASTVIGTRLPSRLVGLFQHHSVQAGAIAVGIGIIIAALCWRLASVGRPRGPRSR
jgi:hypothetical protein